MKECPHCGSEAELIQGHYSGHGEGWPTYFVRCVNCRAQGPTFPSIDWPKDDDQDKAVEAWNKRP